MDPQMISSIDLMTLAFVLLAVCGLFIQVKF